MGKAPKHLSDGSRAIWRRVMEEYAIPDAAGELLLQTALEARDRMTGAQTIVAAEGIVVPDRYGGKRAHPALAIEKDARCAMLLALKHLDLELDLKPQARLGRPPGGRGGL